MDCCDDQGGFGSGLWDHRAPTEVNISPANWSRIGGSFQSFEDGEFEAQVTLGRISFRPSFAAAASLQLSSVRTLLSQRARQSVCVKMVHQLTSRNSTEHCHQRRMKNLGRETCLISNAVRHLHASHTSPSANYCNSEWRAHLHPACWPA